jgi:transaldolase
MPAIENAIFACVSINVIPLFACERYLAAAEAFLREVERRIDSGLKPDVSSVASLFSVAGTSPQRIRFQTRCATQLGIAMDQAHRLNPPEDCYVCSRCCGNLGRDFD